VALTQDVIEEISYQLDEAERKCEPIEPISQKYGDISYEDAYAIQRKTVEIKAASGAVIVGWKIGLTSKAMQEQSKINEPDYGTVFFNRVFREGHPVNMKPIVWPRIEAEIAFFLKDDLKGPGVTVATVLAATEGVMPAFEILDRRHKNYLSIKDSISDNAGQAGVILGGKLTPLSSEIDLRLIGMIIEKNGEIVDTAAGAASLGNPAEAVAWLVNKLYEHGMTLRRGEFIMSGSLTKAINIEAGSFFRATFDRLGTVSALFE
jgi:2-keto-4-pentenoate hydratase